MSIVLQSRFAGLMIEDDDIPAPNAQKAKKKTTKEAPKKTKTTTKPQNGTPTAQPKKKKPKVNAPTSEQWEQWKQKDDEMVDGNFETDLQQALLLSKLDFEHKKELQKTIKKKVPEPPPCEQATNKVNKKQKKKNVMCLEQFNDMVTNGDEQTLPSTETLSDEQQTPEDDTDYFDRIESESKEELIKAKEKQILQDRPQVSDEVMSRLQFAEAIERKNKEIEQLKDEVGTLKDELRTVKHRNKKLCNILGQAEMKDKAEILVEVDKLQAVQSELTSELADLHSLLEKERSKNGDTRTKDKKKKCTDKDK